MALIFDGETVPVSELWLCEYDGDVGSVEVEDLSSGKAGVGERGSGRSSTEYIERSSPFHKSPLAWLFYMQDVVSKVIIFAFLPTQNPFHLP